MDNLNSLADLLSRTAQNEKSFLLLYRSGTSINHCAFDNVKAASSKAEQFIYAADVSLVKDIHPEFGITSVPSLLVFDKQNLTNVIKGCHDPLYYQAVFDKSIFEKDKSQTGKKIKNVVVYSTPTCTWCNTLKSWLNKNNIKYTDIDVSGDLNAAEALLRRSGQQGVPQTDIDGQMVVGFNQQKLKELLEIN